MFFRVMMGVIVVVVMAVPASADETYAAIAWSPKLKTVGRSYGQASAADAKAEAQGMTGDDSAKVVVSRADGWVAIVRTKKNAYGTGYGETRQIAVAEAEKTLAKYSSDPPHQTASYFARWESTVLQVTLPTADATFDLPSKAKQMRRSGRVVVFELPVETGTKQMVPFPVTYQTPQGQITTTSAVQVVAGKVNKQVFLPPDR